MANRSTAPLLDTNPDNPGVKDVALVSSGDAMALFERLATDPNASVEKIERLMALWERGEERRAQGEFNAAMSDAQNDMKPVSADAWNPQTRSRYASYEKLDLALRPIYTGHGFGLSYNTADSPLVEHVRVICLVTHRAGYAREYHLDMPADGKGAKGGDVMTKTHAVGSAVSYGMRYLLKMIFNIAVAESDDDGNAASGQPVPPAPDGFDAWWSGIEQAAAKGQKALDVAWECSEGALKNHAHKWRRDDLNTLRKQAAQAGKAKP